MRGAVPQLTGKRLLIELSKKLEEEALARGETAILTATFQEARHFTPATVRRYETSFVKREIKFAPFVPLAAD